MLTCYAAEKPSSVAFAQMLAAGHPRAVVTHSRRFRPGPAATWGFVRSQVELIKNILASPAPWFYGDNAYFSRGQYFRITRRGIQHPGIGEPDHARWRQHGLTFAPWRRTGRHVVVCPQSPNYHKHLLGLERDPWIRQTTALLRRHTDRRIVVREKPQRLEAQERPIELELRGAWALVTPASGAAVDALLAGVPIFCNDSAATAPMGLSDLTRIEAPAYPDGREDWAAVLAGQQWTEAEIRRGEQWEVLGGVRG